MKWPVLQQHWLGVDGMKYYGQASKYISFYTKYKHTLKDPTTDKDMWGNTIGDIVYPDKHFDRYILDKMLDTPLTVENSYNQDTRITFTHGITDGLKMEVDIVNGELINNDLYSNKVNRIIVNLHPKGKVSYYGYIDPRNNSWYNQSEYLGFQDTPYIYGNVMSLVHSRNFRNNTEMLHDGEFKNLFYTSAYGDYEGKQKPGTCLVFPSKVLRKSCYEGLLFKKKKTNCIAILAEDVSAENCMLKFTSTSYYPDYPKVIYIKKDTIYPETVQVNGYYNGDYYNYLPPTADTYGWRFVKV